jgi:hypothetical protein
MGALLQLMALPAVCMLIAWARGVAAQAVIALQGGVSAPAIARPTLARVPHRPPPCALTLAASSPRLRRAKHVGGARLGSSAGGGLA